MFGERVRTCRKHSIVHIVKYMMSAALAMPTDQLAEGATA